MEHHYNPVDQPVETIAVIEGLKIPGLEEAVSHIPHFRHEGW
jgi:hypothetical protein